MKFFSLFSNKKKCQQSISEGGPPLTSAPQPPRVPRHQTALAKSHSFYSQKPSYDNHQYADHVYHVIDPHRDNHSHHSPVRLMTGPSSRFPISQSFPLNMREQCSDEFFSPSMRSQTGQTMSCSLCKNCQTITGPSKEKPIVKSASPRRHRTMIKTNPWISNSSVNFHCRSNQLDNPRELMNRREDLVSPYATSEDLFMQPNGNPDASMDSGIFEASLQTTMTTSSSLTTTTTATTSSPGDCSDESEEVSSYFQPIPGQKRIYRKHSTTSTTKDLNHHPHQPLEKSRRYLLLRHENYLWRPYLPTNRSFQLPRTNVISQLLSPQQVQHNQKRFPSFQNHNNYNDNNSNSQFSTFIDNSSLITKTTRGRHDNFIL